MTFNAGVALVYGRSAILGKRCESWKGKPVPLAGHWAPFAGAIEEGENPMMAAVRELEEETGIKKKITDLKYINNYINEHGSLVFYIIEVDKMPTIKLNEEHTEVGILDIKELNRFPGKIDNIFIA